MDRVIEDIRTELDGLRPQDCGSMLHVDDSVGGAACHLLSIVNQCFRANVQLAVVEAGMDESNPVTHMGTYTGQAAAGLTDYTHSLVVWHQGRHYVAVTAKPESE